MGDLKTRPTDNSVDDYLGGIEDAARREDCRTIAKIMERATGSKPRMWGPSIVGFGEYHNKYESGREGDWFLTGFASRKNDLTLYIMAGFDRYDELMQRLGKHKSGKACLYIKRISDIDTDVLEQLVRESVLHMKTK